MPKERASVPEHAKQKPKPQRENACRLKPRYCKLRKVYTKQLRHGLQGTPLASIIETLEETGRKWNVNPVFVASIAGVESSFGAAACGGNAWGIGSCSTGFATFAEGGRYTTRMLRASYINHGLRDPWSIGRVYCPPCRNGWGDKVIWFMKYRFGASVSVTYG